MVDEHLHAAVRLDVQVRGLQKLGFQVRAGLGGVPDKKAAYLRAAVQKDFLHRPGGAAGVGRGGNARQQVAVEGDDAVVGEVQLPAVLGDRPVLQTGFRPDRRALGDGRWGGGSFRRARHPRRVQERLPALLLGPFFEAVRRAPYADGDAGQHTEIFCEPGELVQMHQSFLLMEVATYKSFL